MNAKSNASPMKLGGRVAMAQVALPPLSRHSPEVCMALRSLHKRVRVSEGVDIFCLRPVEPRLCRYSSHGECHHDKHSDG